ncbi:MAG: tRNA (guanosine(46)-N7)-methyltransferase TrmB [Candidatus Rariloculaceae bacterium]
MRTTPLRQIRSFVRRSGRITEAQRKALVDLMPRFGLDFSENQVDLGVVFGRTARKVLDIGFGDGEALLTAAANNPSIDYLGVEVHNPGIGHLLLLLEQAGLTNVRIIHRDVVEVLSNMLPDVCLDGVNVYFPDPWPKKRHHKRRLVQPVIASEFARVIKAGGTLHLATDWENYAEHMKQVIGSTGAFARIATEIDLVRPPTKFERRGQRLGHSVWDLIYERLPT